MLTTLLTRLAALLTSLLSPLLAGLATLLTGLPSLLTRGAALLAPLRTTLIRRHLPLATALVPTALLIGAITASALAVLASLASAVSATITSATIFALGRRIRDRATLVATLALAVLTTLTLPVLTTTALARSVFSIAAIPSQWQPQFRPNLVVHRTKRIVILVIGDPVTVDVVILVVGNPIAVHVVVQRIRNSVAVEIAIGTALSVRRDSPQPSGAAPATTLATFSHHTGKRETNKIDLAAGECRAVANRGVTHRFHLPLAFARILSLRQRAKQARKILVPIPHIPAFVTRPESRDIYARILRPKFLGGKRHQVIDGINRIDDR